MLKSDWIAILRKFDYCCAYCGKHVPKHRKHKLTKDHVHPTAKGGHNNK